MSVINKMLRDLDSRQAAGATPNSTRESRPAIARDTLSVNDPDQAGRSRVSRRLGALIVATVMLLGAAAGGWWYLQNSEIFQRKGDQVTVAATTSGATSFVTAAVVASPLPAIPEPANVSEKAAIVTPPVVAKLPVSELSSPVNISLKMDSTFKGVQSHATPSSPSVANPPRAVPERLLTERPLNERTIVPAPTVPAAALAVPASPLRRSPALDALAQAQSLWSSGSREAAIELVREALASAERENLAGTPSGDNSVLASLARELARMELAEGRVSQTLALLTRLEPALSGVADVWAIRGNAAQRLGRHQESAAAYLMALKLRPDEPRWMLGAAVSLAAQGQTAAAAELAEKARAGGVLSPEVAMYLRQLGVPLRER